MFKKLLILSLSLGFFLNNSFGQYIPIKPLPTKYDKKQDKAINKNTDNIEKEADQRKKHDNKLNEIILTEKDDRIKGDDKLNDKIINNKNNIANNTDDITINKDNITSNYNKNQTQDLNIKTNKNNISSNSRKIDSLDNRISELEETQFIVGVEGRVYDSKKLQVNIFADYSTNRNKVDRTGVRFTYKFGQSYEEKLITKQNKRLKQLEKRLGIKNEPEVVGKTKTGLNIVAEANGVIRVDKEF